MENKHEQLYIAVQDLLIELGITPKKLKLIVTDKSCIVDCAASKVSAETAQKLINALSVENFPLITFNKIKSRLAPIILWSYLREKHPEFLSDQIKDYLFPSE
jgi:hypothetical protein